MPLFTRFITALLVMSCVGITIAQAGEEAPAKAADSQPSDPGLDLREVIALLKQQQKDLAEQKVLLQQQAQQIASLQDELDVLRSPAPPVAAQATATSGPASAAADSGSGAVSSIGSGSGTDTDAEPLTTEAIAKSTEPDEQKTAGELKAEAGESVAQAQTDDPTKALLSEFVGAWRLPGTDAALRIGGFVKTDIVYNFDPLEISDRFIVGSIPVGVSDTGIEAQSSLTANQSRLNFDLREPTDFGLLRAFIEGDFAGDGDTFRLRHAFGQWNRVLAGKTWSAFMDTEASPEEVDFEGLNGRINVRQAQVRLMPQRGTQYGLELSLEDPNPQVQDGEGVTRAPDVVVAGRFRPNEQLHLKLSVIGRQIRSQANPGFGVGVSKEYAFGVSLSGRRATPTFDSRDNLLFQLSGGNGIGRYVNDLSSIGSYDGVFNPDDGDLKLFNIVAGYVSWQHWWGGPRSFRSNYTFGFVDVDNPGFVEGDAYKRTIRLSANLFWTPTPRIDVGAEYLWGRRENQDGENGDASQLQLMARYRF